MDTSDLINKYIQTAIEYGKSFEEAEYYRRTNRSSDKCNKYYQEIISGDKEKVQSTVDYLLNHENDYVKFSFAGNHLQLEKEKCMYVLKQLSTNDNIIGTTAKLLVDFSLIK